LALAPGNRTQLQRGSVVNPAHPAKNHRPRPNRPKIQWPVGVTVAKMAQATWGLPKSTQFSTDSTCVSTTMNGTKRAHTAMRALRISQRQRHRRHREGEKIRRKAQAFHPLIN
jgi:hypothetical protein